MTDSDLELQKINKKLPPTMYNRNYDGFDYTSTSSAQTRIHSELLYEHKKHCRSIPF